jgi:alpha-L-fucosidase
MISPIPDLAGEGPYEPTWESLRQYECPEWYSDAKFCIWNAWSPQCVPEDGDWYARNMYIQGSSQNQFQVAHYGPPSRFGYKDSKERLILGQIGQWFKINGEAIYATRPWKIYGEGPHMIKAGSFQGKSSKELGSLDVRYTRNKAQTAVYAIVLGWPEQSVLLRSFGTAAAVHPGKVAHVELLGSPAKIHWHQNAQALRIKLPQGKPASDYSVVFKLSLS